METIYNQEIAAKKKSDVKIKRRGTTMVSLRKVRNFVVLHSRRLYVMGINALFGYDIFFVVIGLIAKNVFKKPIKSVFLMYPSQKKYSEAYVYEWYRKQMQWKPRLAGILWQNGRLSISFIISACDDDIWADKGENLNKVYSRIEEIRICLGAEQKSFAGILPGVLCSKQIMNDSPELEVTVASILTAIKKTKQDFNMPASTLFIVLGGAGFVGSSVIQALKADNLPAISIDLGNTDMFGKLAIEDAIILNITKKGGLQKYVPFMHERMVVINEVYPPPRRNVVEAIKKRGARIFHINGLKGGALPSFPHDYAGGIPCCAGHLPEKISNLEVVLTEL